MTTNSSRQASGTSGAPEFKIDNYLGNINEKKIEEEILLGETDTDKNNENENSVKERQTEQNPFSKKTKEELKIFKGKQDKHIRGTNNFMEGKSEITIPIDELQELVYKKFGKGQVASKDRERIDFGKIIGVFVDKDTKERYETSIGLIHYSKVGTHVVPARPKGV